MSSSTARYAAFVAGKLRRVLLRFAITRLAVVIVLGIYEGIQNLHCGKLVLANPSEQDFFRGFFGVKVPNSAFVNRGKGTGQFSAPT